TRAKRTNAVFRSRGFPILCYLRGRRSWYRPRPARPVTPRIAEGGIGVGVGVGTGADGEKLPPIFGALVLLAPTTDTAVALTKPCEFVSTTKTTEDCPGASPAPAKLKVITLPV